MQENVTAVLTEKLASTIAFCYSAQYTVPAVYCFQAS